MAKPFNLMLAHAPDTSSIAALSANEIQWISDPPPSVKFIDRH
ncbi:MULTISPECIES: hypothetical protein [unclassified Acidovorax]|nr:MULTISPECIES: hypothetical protein [unclassified Acidovorax]